MLVMLPDNPEERVMTSSNRQPQAPLVGDGEYYAFVKQQGNQLSVGYVYTTWCGSPCGFYMRLCPVGKGKTLPFTRVWDSQKDRGQLKLLPFDSQNSLLIDDVYNRACHWLKEMQRTIQYPQLDESKQSLPMVVVVKQGVLSAVYQKDDYKRICSLDNS